MQRYIQGTGMAGFLGVEEFNAHLSALYNSYGEDEHKPNYKIKKQI